MTVKELREKLNLQYICNEGLAEEKEVTGCYCGDLLSWVMSKASEGDAWLTVMGNVTSIGVAVLTEVACIILTENAPADADAIKRAESVYQDKYTFNAMRKSAMEADFTWDKSAKKYMDVYKQICGMQDLQIEIYFIDKR